MEKFIEYMQPSRDASVASPSPLGNVFVVDYESLAIVDLDVRALKLAMIPGDQINAPAIESHPVSPIGLYSNS
jgi:hypothetical protein